MSTAIATRNENLIASLKSGKTTAFKLSQGVGKDGFTEQDYEFVVAAANRIVVTQSGHNGEFPIYTSQPGKVAKNGKVAVGGGICAKLNSQFPTTLYASQWLDVFDQRERILRHIVTDTVWTAKENQDRAGIVSRAQRMLDSLPAAPLPAIETTATVK